MTMDKPSEFFGPNQHNVFKFIENGEWTFHDIVQWCSNFYKNMNSGDPTNVLTRWTIGTYQLFYVHKMKDPQKRRLMRGDFNESIASATIHMIMVAEEILGNDLIHYDKIQKHAEIKTIVSYNELFLELDYCVFGMTRQVLYYELNRKNRLDKLELIVLYDNYLDIIFTILGKNWNQAFNDAIHKLTVSEWKDH